MNKDQKIEAETQAFKNEALLTLLKATAKELKRREEDGSLDQELQEMKLGQLADKLAKVATALKGPTVQIGLNLPAPTDHERLRAASAHRLSPAGKVQLRAEMRKRLAREKKAVIEGEIVKESDAA
jgi:predicted NBD/HSP70 family sugar kinase